MYNRSLATGLFPPKWKIATVIPLQKDGDKSDVNNLRPISLLPLSGKLLEKIIHNRMSQYMYLENNNMLCFAYNVCIIIISIQRMPRSTYKQRLPWVDGQLQNLIKRKKKMYLKSRKCPTIENQQIYKKN